MRRTTWWQLLGVLAVLAYVVWVVTPGDRDTSSGGTAAGQSSSSSGPGRTVTALPDGPVRAASLPAEARETLALVDGGGPFPYDRDGSVFMNRERLLPSHPRGYWREYTVRTPGESDRGARRLVAGDAGEVYYTDDHYASFHRVERGSG